MAENGLPKKSGTTDERIRTLEDQLAKSETRVQALRCVLTQRNLDALDTRDVLAETARNYRLLAENISDVIFVADTEFTLNYVSPSVKRLLGVDPEIVLTRSLDELLTPASAAAARQALREELAAEEREGTPAPDPDRTRVLELELHSAAGATVWAEANVRFLRHHGKPVALLGALRDITQRRNAEA